VQLLEKAFLSSLNSETRQHSQIFTGYQSNLRIQYEITLPTIHISMRMRSLDKIRVPCVPFKQGYNYDTRNFHRTVDDRITSFIGSL
jgi:hypothetical protein